MKVSITGASAFVNRMFEACGPYQWAREFLKNAIEAAATRIEFGIEWQAVERKGVYRRTIIDDGHGMSAPELKDFFATLGAGSKQIGGVHDNFGLGARIASLPWNPNGVVVVSYRDGKAAMIWILLDPDSGDYELVEFQTLDGTSCVIDPAQIDWRSHADGTDWGALRPDWVTDHGTIIVLLGSDEYPDTVLGNVAHGESDIKGVSVYLNTRFWDLTDREVRVAELRSERKNSWPLGPNDSDDTRRPNNRRIMGAWHWIADVTSSKGKALASDEVRVDDDRVTVEWYLWEGERPAIHSYAKKGGYVAVRYNGELFELSSHKAHFRWFGIIEGAVQQNLTLIIEPPHYVASNARWGIHPDQSRNRLIFTGNGQKGVALPLADWGAEFADGLPEPILEAIHAARGDIAGSIDDDEYRKRLQEKFGNRWMMKVLVKSKRRARSPISVIQTGDDVPVQSESGGEGGDGPTPEPDIPQPPRRRKKAVMVVRRKALAGEGEDGVERETPVDVPQYRYGRKDDFQRPWHLAQWAPNDIGGPFVVMNADSPILEEAIRYHQEHYPDVLAEEVQSTVRKVFGEIAACKVAHSQKLVGDIPIEQVNELYRSEEALTIALMGLLAEESLIAQRLGKLGRKRDSAA